MTLDAAGQDYVKRAVELREAGRLDEALLAARRATTADAGNANAWWQLALATWAREGAAAAIPALRKTVELADAFAYGWHRLGNAYQLSAMLHRAIDAWARAVEEDPDRADSWRQLAEAYKVRDLEGDGDRQFEALQALERLGQLDGELWNLLGNCYFDRDEQHRAIRCYQQYALLADSYVAYYNLAQSFHSAQIQQPTDAIDAWRRAVRAGPEDDDAQTRLDTWLPRALALRQRVLKEGRLELPQPQWYANFVCPYELLGLRDEEGLDRLPVKAIQQAKKRLLQEIELEEGVVHWMPGLVIDRSRAIRIADELLDEASAARHQIVARHRELGAFLSRGDIRFFLVDPEQSPIDLLAQVAHDPQDFGAWLSERFAPQYDQVLTQALEARDLAAIEALLGGRRLVRPEHEDRCFEGAVRQVQAMLAPLHDSFQRFERHKPTVEGVNLLLQRGSVDRIVALLPMHFQDLRNELAALVRGASIDAHNHHDDPDLALELLSIGRRLADRSPAVMEQIEEDERTLQGILKRQSRFDASVLLNGVSYSITRQQVTFGSRRLAVKDVRKVRFGAIAKRDANGRTLEFSMEVVGSDQQRLSMGWTATRDFPAQEKLFKGMQDAAFNYLLPPVIEHLQSEMDQGRWVQVGPVLFNKQGVQFNVRGWFTQKVVHCPWSRVTAALDNGELTVADRVERKARYELPLASTDNAIALFLIINKHTS